MHVEGILDKYINEGKSISVEQMKEILKIHTEIMKIEKIKKKEDELYFRALIIYYSVYGKYNGDFNKLKEIVKELKERGGWE